MINNIYSSSSSYLNVSGHNNTPYVSPDPSGNPATGMIRMNGNHCEVYNGVNWLAFGSSAEISLSGAAISALDWCQRKMIEEAKIQELAAKSPTVADAFAAYNEARSKLEMVLTLTDAQ